MSPIANNLGWVTHKAANLATRLANAGTNFAAHVKSAQAQAQAPSVVPEGPSRATISHPHPGGMNDAAHRLLQLARPG